MIKRCKSREKN